MLRSKAQKNAQDNSLSEGQKALWVISQLAPESYAYNIPMAFWLEANTELTALRRSFKHLLARH